MTPRLTVLLAAGYILLATALRVPNLGAQSLWVDEVTSLDNATRPVASILTLPDGYPPLWDLVLKATGRWSGSELRGRVVSAVAGVLSIALMFLLALRLADRRTAVLATALLAASPMHVWYSREGRVYALVALLSIVSSLCFVSAVRDGRPRAWAAYGAVTVTGLFSHYLYAGVAAAQGLFVLLYAPARRTALRPMLAVAAVIGVVLALAAPILRADFVAAGAGWTLRPFHPFAIPYTPFIFFAGFGIGPTLTSLHRGMSLSALTPYWREVVAVAVTGVVLGVLGLWALRTAGAGGFYVLLWLVVPPTLTLLGARFTGVAYNVRYAIGSLPAFVLTLAFGLARRPVPLAAGWLVAVLIVSTLSVSRDRFDSAYGREDMRAAAQYLTSTAAPGERIIVTADYVEPVIAHYYRGPATLGELPSRPIRTEAEAAALIEQLEHDGPATWLVLSRDWDDDPAGLLRHALVAAAPHARAANFPGVDIYRLGS